MNNNEIIEREKAGPQKHFISEIEEDIKVSDFFYEAIGFKIQENQSTAGLQTIEDLLDRDEQRAKDGFPRRIKLGKIVKPGKNKQEVVVVPTTTEPKFYHDDSITDEDETTGGTGEGEDGEVIGEAPMQPEQREGEGSGPGQGEGGGHDVISNAFDLGKILTEKFQLPNLKSKGKKRSFTKYTYDLTDKNRRFGQILDKKETLRRLIKTNILLGNIDPNEEIDLDNLILNPNDAIYRILSPEKDFETTAVVFFLRDYSGSMQGKPTEVITTQHLFIYSWLMYQYNQNVQTRFILHDQTAKEVPDFYTYHNSNVAGGTNVYPAFELVNKIVETEQLARENNIYVFYGTDGDDWDSDGKKALDEIGKILTYVSRMGITIAKNAWSGASSTTVEKYIERSGLLISRAELLKLDSFGSANADETRIIEGIRKLVEQHSH
jgi:hypothetical protein